jgi:hypothetical protein
MDLTSFPVDGQTALHSELPSSIDMQQEDKTEHAVDHEHALHTIVAHLRRELDNMSTSYDKVLSRLGELRSDHAKLQAASSDSCDEIDFLRRHTAELAGQVKTERTLRECAEAESAGPKEAVSVLRQQLEESRRAIMRLQAEARQSGRRQKRPTSLVSGLSGLGGEGRPATVDGSGRSTSAPAGRSGAGGVVDDAVERMRRNMQVEEATRALDGSRGEGDATSKRERRHLSLLGLGLPGSMFLSGGSNNDVSQHMLPLALSPTLPSSPRSPTPEADEVATLRAQVTTLRQELAEANEARQASDTCLKALREIVLSSDAFQGISLPPLPTDVDSLPTQPAGPKQSTNRWSLLSSLGRPRSPPTSSSAEEVSATPVAAGGASDLSSRALSLVALVRGGGRSRTVSPAASSGGLSDDGNESLAGSPPSLSDGGDASSAPPSAFSSPRPSSPLDDAVDDISSDLLPPSATSADDARKETPTAPGYGPEIVGLDDWRDTL